MKKYFVKNMEWGILVCSVLLLAIGLVALFSTTQNADYDEFKKQIVWFLISIPVIAVVICIDYNIIAKLSPIFYGIFIILLIVVFFTSAINGATSWFNLGIFSFQPGEFAKVFVILFIAYLIDKLCKNGREQINNPLKLGAVILAIAVPVALIIKQPDYGTAIAFLVAFAFMIFTSGIRAKYIIVTLILIVILLPIAYFFILPDHAKTRIDVYLNPDIDPRGAGYNIIQSKLAIGAGQLLGMGIFKGNQTQLGFLYPKTTDFIFSAIGEEFGFIACSAIIIIYVILITKAVYVAKTAKDDIGSYIAIGIAGMFFFHMLENIGMTMGLLPITGIPLPFVSYGGSNLLTNFIAIALLLNISARRQKALFIK